MHSKEYKQFIINELNNKIKNNISIIIHNFKEIILNETLELNMLLIILKRTYHGIFKKIYRNLLDLLFINDIKLINEQINKSTFYEVSGILQNYEDNGNEFLNYT